MEPTEYTLETLPKYEYEDETLSKTHPWVTIPNDLLELVKNKVIEDSSWVNDGLPSFTFGPDNKFQLWVNTREPNHPWRDTEDRFQIFLNDCSVCEEFLTSDDLQSVLNYIHDNK
jgi:hypothetical protein